MADREFIQLDENDDVIATLVSNGVPGAGPGLPAGFKEVTGRVQGRPFDGKHFNQAADLLEVKASPPDSTDEVLRKALVAQAGSVLSAVDQSSALILILKTLRF